MVGTLFAVVCVLFCHSCLPCSSIGRCLKPPVATQTHQMSLMMTMAIMDDDDDDDDDDVPELDDGDSDMEPDETDKKRPVVEEGDSSTDGPVPLLCFSSLAYFCITLQNSAEFCSA